MMHSLLVFTVCLIAIFAGSSASYSDHEYDECQAGWTSFGVNGKRSCYSVFEHNEEESYSFYNGIYNTYRRRKCPPNTFDNAIIKCKDEYNATLAIIQSRQEYSFIRALITKSHGINTSLSYDEHRFWVGMRLGRNQNGTITKANWVNNQAVTFGSPLARDHEDGKFPWGMNAGYGGEPNNVLGEENCVAIGASVHKDGFVDVKCSEKLTGFICQKEALKKKCGSYVYSGDTTGSRSSYW